MQNNFGNGNGYGYGYGFGFGYGVGFGVGFGYGNGNGNGYGNGNGNGYGNGNGVGFGFGYGVGYVDSNIIMYLHPFPYLKIGCEVHSIKFWIDNYITIAKNNDVDISTLNIDDIMKEIEKVKNEK